MRIFYANEEIKNICKNHSLDLNAETILKEFEDCLGKKICVLEYSETESHIKTMEIQNVQDKTLKTVIVKYDNRTTWPFSKKVKRIFRVFDHSSIPLLIAGSYTPFCLIALDGNIKGKIVVCVVWLCGVLAIVLNIINLDRFEKINLVLYIAMGWAVVFALKDIILALPKNGFILLAAGGIAYTTGIIFYKMTTVRYMHSVWHLFVTAGSLAHFLCVAMYVLPMTY